MILAVSALKGGPGKTTFAVNIAAGLAIKLSGRTPRPRILLVDLDPQAHAAYWALGKSRGDPLPIQGDDLSAHLLGNAQGSPLDVIHPAAFPRTGNLDVALVRPHGMAQAERVLTADLTDGIFALEEYLESIRNAYAAIVVDTPPSAGAMTLNALVAADWVLIPMELTKMGVDGLRETLAVVEKVRRRYNPDLRIVGIAPNRCDFRRTETNDIYRFMRQQYKDLVLLPVSERAQIAYAASMRRDIFSQLGRTQDQAVIEMGRLVDAVARRMGLR